MSVLVAPPPQLTADEAARLARDQFGVVGTATPLPSERDQNFAVAAADGSRWVLKVSNSAEALEVVEMENEAMAHVARVEPSLPVPRLRVTAADEAVVIVDGHLVRLLQLLPGSRLRAEDLDERSLERFGNATARLGRALRSFFHPAAGRVLQWDVQHFSALRPLLATVEDAEANRLVEAALDDWDTHVMPHLAELRAQIVHGDVSLDNTLFGPDGAVSGVIDFGDVSYTPLLCDIAVALVSVMAGAKDPVSAADAFMRGYESITPLEELERTLLRRFVAARAATSLAIAAWRVRLYPDNADYITLDTDRFLALLRLLQEEARSGGASTAELIERRARAFGPAMQTLTYRRPVHMVRAEGVWMFDVDGRRYLDAYNNVPVVGHSHPRVVDAVVRQSRTLNTNLRYLHEAAIELAERLLASMPPTFGSCFFVNSGSEANEVAWRVATAASARRGGVVTDFAYHGVTAATAALSPEEWGADEPAHVARINPAAGAADLDRAAADLRSRGYEPAALLLDGCFTSDGILNPPSSYHAELVEKTHALGAYFVADEVQAGHGRTGEHLWCFAANGISPDLVTIGKPMGNGFPVAAVLMTRALGEAVAATTSSMFSTFGGNPVAAAAGLAVLDVIEEERLIERASAVGGYLRSLLEELAFGAVRGRGLLIGVELENATTAGAIVDGLRDRGVLIGRTGRGGNVLKIRPPLVFEREHADLLVERLAETLREIRNRA